MFTILTYLIDASTRPVSLFIRATGKSTSKKWLSFVSPTYFSIDFKWVADKITLTSPGRAASIFCALKFEIKLISSSFELCFLSILPITSATWDETLIGRCRTASEQSGWTSYVQRLRWVSLAKLLTQSWKLSSIQCFWGRLRSLFGFE